MSTASPPGGSATELIASCRWSTQLHKTEEDEQILEKAMTKKRWRPSGSPPGNSHGSSSGSPSYGRYRSRRRSSWILALRKRNSRSSQRRIFPTIACRSHSADLGRPSGTSCSPLPRRPGAQTTGRTHSIPRPAADVAGEMFHFQRPHFSAISTHGFADPKSTHSNITPARK